MSPKLDKFCQSLVKTPATNSCRYRINWFVIYSVSFLTGLSILIQSPSLHQFITSSNNQSNNANIEPGLGLSETWYTISVSITSIGTFFGAIIYSLLARHIYFKPALVVELIIIFIGGLLYSFGNTGWLILISRLLTGAFTGIHMSLSRIYVLETSEKLIQTLPEEKRAKSTIKYTALFMLFLHAVTGTVFGPIVVAIAAQIPSISDFHWPGYYMSMHSFLLLVLVIVVFDERWMDATRRIKSNINNISIKERILKEFRNPALPHYLSGAFIFLYFIFGWNLSIVETLQNPILSDQFGLDVRSSSYVFIGVVSIHLISVIIMYVCQKVRIDNRLILLVVFFVSIIGTLTMTDWQSIGGDPCNQFNYDEIISITDYNTTELSYYCEQFSNNTNNCFWNPISRINGDYCDRCRPVCLSDNHSLNFIQLLIGIIFLSSSMAPGRLLVTTIASDVAGSNAQPVVLMGALVAAADVSRVIGPLWENSMYLAINHRTWLPMNIMTGLQLLGIVIIILLYRKMKKRTSTGAIQKNEDLIELIGMEEESVEL